jgi:hypothetical protein
MFALSTAIANGPGSDDASVVGVPPERESATMDPVPGFVPTLAQ